MHDILSSDLFAVGFLFWDPVWCYNIYLWFYLHSLSTLFWYTFSYSLQLSFLVQTHKPNPGCGSPTFFVETRKEDSRGNCHGVPTTHLTSWIFIRHPFWSSPFNQKTPECLKSCIGEEDYAYGQPTNHKWRMGRQSHLDWQPIPHDNGCASSGKTSPDN